MSTVRPRPKQDIDHSREQRVQPAFRATKALIYRWPAQWGNASPAPYTGAQAIRLTAG
jgi:hypothetical protein